MHSWEEVKRETSGSNAVYRMAVPSGWVYRFADVNGFTYLFIPESNVEKAASYMHEAVSDFPR
jgi:hypothetical protein